jgi:hypothetical protein
MSLGPQILLLFVTIGAVFGAIDAMGIWTQASSSYSMSISTDQINSTQLSATSQVPSVFTYVIVLANCMITIFKYILTSLLSLPAMFWMMGFPVNAVTVICLQMIQAPFQWVMFTYLFELWTGRPQD